MSFLGQQSTQCSINSISEARFTGCSQPVPSVLIAGALLYTSDKVIMYVIDSHHSYNMLTLCACPLHTCTLYTNACKFAQLWAMQYKDMICMYCLLTVHIH